MPLNTTVGFNEFGLPPVPKWPIELATVRSTSSTIPLATVTGQFQFQPLVWTTATVQPGDALKLQANIAAGPNFFDIVKIKITPDSGTEAFNFRIYKKGNFDPAKRFWRAEKQVPPLLYPVDITNGLPGVEATEGAPLPYTDEDGTGQLHYEIVNLGVSPHTYTVAIEYREVPQVSSTGAFTFRGGLGKFTTGFISAGVSALPATSGTVQSTGLGLRITPSDSLGGLDIGTAGTAGSWIQAVSSGSFATNYPLLLNPNGGNVGIGTTNPSETLHVNGTGRSTRLGLGTASDANIQLYTVTGSAVLPLNSGSSAETSLGYRLATNSNAGVLDVGSNGTGGSWIQARNSGNFATDYPILLNPNGGGVAIGTTSVGAGLALDINGTFRAQGAGPHAIGGGLATNVQLTLAGGFTPGAGTAISLSNQTNFALSANQSSISLNVNPTFTKASSGTHSLLAGIQVADLFVAGAASVTDAIGIDISNFTAPASTTNATGLRVAGPGGGATAYAIHSLNGIVQMDSTSGPEYFVINNKTAGIKSAAIQFQDSGTPRWTVGMDPSQSNNTNFAFRSTQDSVDRLVISTAGAVQFPSVGTTASAANAFLDNAASNNLLRSTSSIRYKRNIDALTIEEARQIFDFRPVTFNSIASADDPQKRFWGLIAEETDALLPDVFTIWTRGPGGKAIPDGLDYGHMVAPLIRIAQDHDRRLAALETRLP